MEEKVKAVEAVFAEVDEAIDTFKNWSTIHCPTGCGKCCFQPNIQVSVLEALPLAYQFYNEGTAVEWYDKLKENEDGLCLHLNPLSKSAGMCTQYVNRPLMCRLFGYAARKNKHGIRELVTCDRIKTEQKDAYDDASARISQGESVPVIADYYRKLHSVDFDMAQEFFPINKAIRKAIEIILQYYAYRSA